MDYNRNRMGSRKNSNLGLNPKINQNQVKNNIKENNINTNTNIQRPNTRSVNK